MQSLTATVTVATAGFLCSYWLKRGSVSNRLSICPSNLPEASLRQCKPVNIVQIHTDTQTSIKKVIEGKKNSDIKQRNKIRPLKFNDNRSIC